MNKQIVDNLYEFWEHVGGINNNLSKTKSYTAVSADTSDWPNRIFNLKTDNESVNRIIQLSKNKKLPEILTIHEPVKVIDNPDIKFLFNQKNMAIDMHLVAVNTTVNRCIKRVNTETDSVDFANTASQAFGYKVDYNIIINIVNSSALSRLFLFKENSVCLGCGIVFFDSNNNAGLHMIGTIPEGRGKGVGKSLTEHLLQEAKKYRSEHCVLHASAMGESVYSKLGFKPYGKIETYKIKRG
ncbi:MAG: GNAT family N-acetyltransferase [Bacteroidales bacterium]|jgi:ribosomal protein S18 acetylase RimI-like enzyme|nr:GNAT family N-acetyltransferase [Bacteroidales bacterium]